MLRRLRPDNRIARRDQRVGEPREDRRAVGDRAAGLLGVFAVVDADAQDFFRIGNRRQQFDVAESDPIAAAAGQFGKLIETELEYDDGIIKYDLKVLRPNGRVQEVELDAATGELLKIEDDD